MRKHLEGITARGKNGDKVQKLAKTKNFSKHIDFSLFNNSLNLYMKTKKANSAKRFVEAKQKSFLNQNQGIYCMKGFDATRTLMVGNFAAS